MASIEDQYQKAWELCQGESHNDPDTEPYKSKYAAREIFEELKSRLSKQLDEDDVDEESNSFSEEGVDGVALVRARMAAIVYHLGVIAVETEEFSTGEEYLNNALIIVGDEAGISAGLSSAEVDEAQVVTAALLGDSDSLLSSSSSRTSATSITPTAIAPSTIALSISCHNQLGILWSNRGLYATSRHHLDRADALYTEYQLKSTKLPRTIHSLFSSPTDKAAEDKSGVAALEKLHTLTFYYLAQVYGHLGAPDKSAWYCHSTLQRQLASKDYEPLEWAINAATLSQFYQGKEKFRVSRHLLASASKVLMGHEAEINTSEAETGDATLRQEKYTECKADVARCWGRYCLVLLQVSCERALPDEASQQEQESDLSQDSQQESLDQQLEFLQLEVSDLESEVSATPVQDFDEARQLFLAGLRWLTEARQHYTLEDHASDHVSITQEMSHLYKALAFFEPSEDRRSKMHKRRVDLLTVLIKELNPQYYLNVCRQINYELAETYSAMMDSKLAIVDGEAVRPTAQQTKKINTLATSSIQHFLHYLDSLKDKTTGEQPATYPEESLRPALVAWFHLGRLWSKLITAEPSTKMQNMMQSLQNYKRIVEYCDQHPDSQTVMAQELAICREMVQLLPLKVEQYRAMAQ